MRMCLSETILRILNYKLIQILKKLKKEKGSTF
jgi:hypothetical protein